MKFDSLQFVVFSLIAITLLRTVPPGRLRDTVILSLNLFFLSSFASTPLQFVPLILFVVFGYGIILLASRVGSVIGIALLLVVAAFVWLKHYSAIAFLPTLPFPYLVVGLSYILFRIIHLLVDVAQGAMRVPRLVDYLNYVFFFLTFVSGPIQRFQDFVAQAAKPQIKCDALHINLAVERVILGYFMIIVVCSFTSYFNARLALHLYHYHAFASALNIETIVFYAAISTIQLIHLYINFAGYMHICIGIGYLAGFILPENFDKPYKAKNFLDFWSRWHITLSEWFKFYLFNPILKAMSARSNTAQIVPYLGAVAFFATFFVMGIWHGTNIIFVFYGLALASGVTFNKLWQIQINKWLGKTEYKRLSLQPWYVLLSRASTLSFFTIILTCTWIDPEQVEQLTILRGIMLGIATFFILLILFALTAWAVNWACRIANWRRVISTTGNGWRYSAVVALKLFVLVNLSYILGSSPEFVYKAF